MTHAHTTGLSASEAARLLAEVGPNALPEVSATPLWRRFLRQFQSPLIYLLLFALVFDLGAWVYEGAPDVPAEAIAIALVLLLNAALGTVQEYRSEQALAQLKALAAPLAWVVRDGKLVHLSSRELVPGDVIRVEAGERIPADGALTEADGVMTDEAVLTGESLPVEKSPSDQAFSGTMVVRGKGYLRITRTGPQSTMGKLATMLADIKMERVRHSTAQSPAGLSHTRRSLGYRPVVSLAPQIDPRLEAICSAPTEQPQCDTFAIHRCLVRRDAR